MEKKRMLSIRLTEELYQKLCYVAKRGVRTPSDMARYLILEHIRNFEALFERIEL